MVRTPSKLLTLEEFLTLPETKPASEYIDGQIIQTVFVYRPKQQTEVFDPDFSPGFPKSL
jgi:Uma2 family endonuclease